MLDATESRLLAAGYKKSFFGTRDGKMLWHPPGTTGKLPLVTTAQAIEQLDAKEGKENACGS
jgi:hypothetical protein